MTTRLEKHLKEHAFECLTALNRVREELTTERIRTAKFPRVIGLCGSAGAGKDTVSLILSFFGYNRLAFGDALKIEAYDCITQNNREILALAESHGAGVSILLPKPDELMTAWDKVEIINDHKEPLRKFLQWYGTEFRRAQNENYWIDIVDSQIAGNVYKWNTADTRFSNEIAIVRKHGGEIWEIVGRSDNYTPTNHASEMEWRKERKERYIDNSSSVTHLVNQIFEAIFGERTRAA